MSRRFFKDLSRGMLREQNKSKTTSSYLKIKQCVLLNQGKLEHPVMCYMTQPLENEKQALFTLD